MTLSGRHLTFPRIFVAANIVLPPGAAQQSRIASPGCGSRISTTMPAPSSCTAHRPDETRPCMYHTQCSPVLRDSNFCETDFKSHLQPSTHRCQDILQALFNPDKISG